MECASTPHPGRTAAAAPRGGGPRDPRPGEAARRPTRTPARHTADPWGRGACDQDCRRDRPVKQIRVHGPHDVRLDDVPSTPPGPARRPRAHGGLWDLRHRRLLRAHGRHHRPADGAGPRDGRRGRVGRQRGGRRRARRPGHRPPGRRGAGPAGQRRRRRRPHAAPPRPRGGQGPAAVPGPRRHGAACRRAGRARRRRHAGGEPGRGRSRGTGWPSWAAARSGSSPSPRWPTGASATWWPSTRARAASSWPSSSGPPTW